MICLQIGLFFIYTESFCKNIDVNITFMCYILFFHCSQFNFYSEKAQTEEPTYIEYLLDLNAYNIL